MPARDASTRRGSYAGGGPLSRQPNVRVVAGEGSPGLREKLRAVLRREGFDVAGTAGGLARLEALLASTNPDVVVLGPELGAIAVSSAREALPLAGIVVVWPSGVIGIGADAQVDPSRIADELGEAVRRAAQIAAARRRAAE